jgi:hypothetical protein
MIGDAILWLRVSLAELVCIHDYSRQASLAFTWHECVKCKRTRNWNSKL